MYRTLFDSAALAIFAWIALVFFPTWRVTRRIADSAIFPVYISVLYAAGIFAALREMGPGFMADFGTVDGVLGLLRSEPVALVAWIHILAFDQVVAHLIYRDNMKHRFVPLPVQSVILIVTLMLGPLGFLSYWLIRLVRGRRLVAWGDPDELAADPGERPTLFAEIVRERTLKGAALGLLRQESALVIVGLLGVAMAGATSLVALVHGGWLMEPEGRLQEAVRFDLALGIYTLTVAMLLPLSGMGAASRRRWQRWSMGLALYGYAIENVQAWRGVDPRFDSAVVNQIFGAVFFVQALGILILFVALTGRFFRDDVLRDHAPLRSALRYGAAATYLAFFVGILMSGVQGRVINGAGDLIAIHAAGFHGLQAVPVVALLLGWSRVAESSARRWVGIAGSGWLLFCFALLLQALLGLPTGSPGVAFPLGLAGAGAWLIALLYAWWAHRTEPVLATS